VTHWESCHDKKCMKYRKIHKADAKKYGFEQNQSVFYCVVVEDANGHGATCSEPCDACDEHPCKCICEEDGGCTKLRIRCICMCLGCSEKKKECRCVYVKNSNKGMAVVAKKK
jgi:hypothetical protein